MAKPACDAMIPWRRRPASRDVVSTAKSKPAGQVVGVRICQFYLSESRRSLDLARRAPCEARLGLVEGEQVLEVLTPSGESAVGLDLPAYLEAAGESPGAQPRPTGERHESRDVFMAPPVLRPRAFLDFYTFEQHVKTCRAKRGLEVVPEWYRVPAYYNSNTSALFGHGQRVPFPAEEDRLDFELELACIIGQTCRNVPEAEADAVIAGYTILNDWSARSLQMEVMKIGLGPARGKDHASSLGPCLVTRDEVPDVRDLAMRAYVNDTLWSEGNSGSSHYTFAEMIGYASRTRTLYPGDVLGSGTVGGGCGLEQDRFLSPGNRVRLEIDDLGEIENEVFLEPRTSVRADTMEPGRSRRADDRAN